MGQKLSKAAARNPLLDGIKRFLGLIVRKMISSTTSFSRIFHGGISVFLKSFRIIGLSQGSLKRESFVILDEIEEGTDVGIAGMLGKLFIAFR
jgi:hypothetical protein